MSINNCKLVSLPKMVDNRGKLTFIESDTHIPFDIKRVFYVYDIPVAIERGAHAHQDCQQFIICLAGALDVKLDDGINKKTIHLSKPYEGLYIPTYIWAAEENFVPGTVYLVLASHPYDERDYFRNYDDFLNASKKYKGI